MVGPGDRTAGFFPGSPWYLFEATGDATWKTAALRFTAPTAPQVRQVPARSRLHAGRRDGMIVSSRMREHEMAWMTEVDKLRVFFGSLAELPLPIVTSDDHAGAHMLAQHLRMLGHRRIAYLGFSDETAGQGRCDRYSILLAAEICERFIETGLSVAPELKALLRKSASVALNAANADGSGFTMGRSLGPYGETAMQEILSTAAYQGSMHQYQPDREI
jgi:hypothetical protein